MKKNQDLTTGKIFPTLIKLALPIIATSFVQMAYNLTDLIWIGRVGGKSVAAVGTAGFFIWLSFAFVIVSKIGAEVGVAQMLGKKDAPAAEHFARNALQINMLLAILYGLVIYLFAPQFIAFFRLGDDYVIEKAIHYLRIISFGMIFSFSNPVFTGIYNGAGDSRSPFLINSVGLGLNILLDPLFIFGLGFIPAMYEKGAAFATIFSQAVVWLLFWLKFTKRDSLFSSFSLFVKPHLQTIRTICKFGLPVAVQSALFTIFAMFLARIVTRWGAIPIAAQKVGAQIEAISWMTASGFSSALSAFVGQNFGAQKWDRIWRVYFSGLMTVSGIGIFASLLFIFFAEPIFSIFIPEAEAIRLGAQYLRILGFSQFFMCVEIATSGAFNGLGRTVPPAIISILFTGARVPMALFLAQEHVLGLNGVWWSISLSSIFKGIILVFWFIILLYSQPTLKPNIQLKTKLFRWDFRFLRDKKSLSGKD
jgi:putative MATE family efflux protein